MFQKSFDWRVIAASLSVCISAIMKAVRDSWTDERLDDGFDRVAGEIQTVGDEVRSVKQDLHSHRVEVRKEFQAVRGEIKEEFKAVRGEIKEEFRAVRGEIKEEFKAVRGEVREELHAVRTEMGEGFTAIRGELGQIHTRLDGLQRTFTQLCIGIIVALVGLIATQL